MKGIYCLIIEIKKCINKKIGKLGNIDFNKGSYIYVGSAQNGIEERVKRHFKKKKKKYWHVDYLLDDKNVKIEKYLCKKGSKKEECKIAKFLASFGDIIQGFGCSDCKCISHLFRINKLDLNKLNMGEP